MTWEKRLGEFVWLSNNKWAYICTLQCTRTTFFSPYAVRKSTCVPLFVLLCEKHIFCLIPCLLAEIWFSSSRRTDRRRRDSGSVAADGDKTLLLLKTSGCWRRWHTVHRVTQSIWDCWWSYLPVRRGCHIGIRCRRTYDRTCCEWSTEATANDHQQTAGSMSMVFRQCLK